MLLLECSWNAALGGVLLKCCSWNAALKVLLFSGMLLLECCSWSAALGMLLRECCWNAALRMLLLECSFWFLVASSSGVVIAEYYHLALSGSLYPEIRE